MAKPFFIIRLPKTNIDEEKEMIKYFKAYKQAIYDEYHVLFVFNTEIKQPQFEVFNSKGRVPKITISELQETILNNG